MSFCSADTQVHQVLLTIIIRLTVSDMGHGKQGIRKASDICPVTTICWAKHICETVRNLLIHVMEYFEKCTPLYK